MVLIPEMYEESCCFDPNSMQGGLDEDGFSQTHVSTNCNPNEHSYHQNQDPAAAAAMEMEFQQQCYNITNGNNQSENHLVQEMMQHEANHVLPCDQTNWYDMSSYHSNQNQEHQDQQAEMQNGQQQSLSATLLDTPYPSAPNHPNMFGLPTCSASSFLQNSSISFATSAQKSSNFLTSLGLIGDLPMADGASASTLVYDPLLPLNLPPQPPLLRELFHSLPHGYNFGASMIGGSLFSGVDDREGANGGLYQDGDGRPFTNGVFEFSGDMDSLVKAKSGKETKHFTTERQRRVHLNDKYSALRSLVPNPTKNDRASIVGDGIEYIRELKRTVNELKILVEKKKSSRERIKRQKTGEGVDINEIKTEDIDQPNNGSALRSSWLHRKSKNIEVDVQIIHDEVTVKLVQQKRINCLLFVSKVLDDLQLDLHYVAGGVIGDYYSFLFNSKICEGSTVYAHAIANKLIEIVDKQYAAILPTNSY